MAEKPQPFDPLDPEQAARRAAARQRLDAIDPAKKPGEALKDPKRREWFEAVYALSEGDPVNVPWGHLVANPLLLDWLARPNLSYEASQCSMSDAGSATTPRPWRSRAPQSRHSISCRARRNGRSDRFPDSGIEFRAADLFAPPPEWRGAFDLVHETYTLQALPAAILPDARKALVGSGQAGRPAAGDLPRARRGSG